MRFKNSEGVTSPGVAVAVHFGHVHKYGFSSFASVEIRRSSIRKFSGQFITLFHKRYLIHTLFSIPPSGINNQSSSWKGGLEWHRRHLCSRIRLKAKQIVDPVQDDEKRFWFSHVLDAGNESGKVSDVRTSQLRCRTYRASLGAPCSNAR